jgi:hypothetical protein
MSRGTGAGRVGARRCGAGLLVAASVALLGGCVDLKQEVFVMPDGSGKLKVTVGMNEKGMQDAMGGFGGGGGAQVKPSGKTDVDVEKLREDTEGFVAFTEPREYKKGGWNYVTFTGYFEDINKAKLTEKDDAGNRKTTLAFSFKPDGGGYVLAVEGGLLGDNAPGGGPGGPGGMGGMGGAGGGGDAMPGMEAMMAQMLKGFKVLETYTMPGNVTRIQGLTGKAGRTATLSVGEKTMADPKAAKAANLSGTKKIWCGPKKVRFTEQSEFKAEMRRAKAAWARIKRKADQAKAKKEAARGASARTPGGPSRGGLPAGAKIPASTASGKVRGKPFTVERAEIQNGILKLRQGKDFFADKSFTIFLFLKKGESAEGKSFNVTPQSGFGSPHIHLSYKVEGKQLPKTDMLMEGYTMQLEFGRAQGKKLPGKIRLVLPADKKSHVAGTFVAEIKD